MILICYDGSEDAKAAIERGAALLKEEQPVTVLTVWQPFVEVLAHMPLGGFGLMPSGIDFEEMDAASSKNAQERAEEGAQLARAGGLNAQPQTCSQETTTGEAILARADALNASAILMGSRGLSGIKSRLLGSVSHAVIQHADRPVIVVPSPDVAAARERERAVHDEG